MNERIRQLWSQADELANEVFDYDGSNYDDIVKEKFAQLLIQACGEWFNDRLVVNPDYGLEHRVERNRAVIGVMKEFNQHFG
jgi:hypothetical protein